MLALILILLWPKEILNGSIEVLKPRLLLTLTVPTVESQVQTEKENHYVPVALVALIAANLSVPTVNTIKHFWRS